MIHLICCFFVCDLLGDPSEENESEPAQPHPDKLATPVKNKFTGRWVISSSNIHLFQDFTYHETCMYLLAITEKYVGC